MGNIQTIYEMTIAIPLTVQIDHSELKYTLRSLEKFLTVPFEVIIIGEHLPDWLNNVTQIELPDIRGRKQLSIRRKILAALEFAEEIVFFNDDMYLLEKTDNFPYYYHGYLNKYTESGSKPLEKQLEALGKPTKHFDGHFGLVYDQRFKEASKNFTEDVIIKSMFCNFCEIDGTFFPDCKLLTDTKPDMIRKFIEGKPSFSTGPYSLKSALPLLEEMFPNESKFEI